MSVSEELPLAELLNQEFIEFHELHFAVSRNAIPLFIEIRRAFIE